MKVDICDVPRMISVNKLEQVRSAHLFSNKKMMYDPEGILSSEIFGISKNDRRSTFAYIDLGKHFIHPHVFIVMKQMFKSVIYIISGTRKYSIKDGQVVQDDEGWTGLDELYKHWNQIDWRNYKSSNKEAKEMLAGLPRDKLFVTKILVCPPAYRDVMIAGTMDSSDHVNMLNEYYTTLIRSVSSLAEGGIFARVQYATQTRIQNILVDIYNFGKEQISKKQGLIRKNLLGKSVDFGVRAVISAPTYNFERFEDNIVDINHTAVPIGLCCSLFYPFIEAWLKNFFTREIINDPNLITYYDVKNKREITATIKDPELQFSEKNIKKMINNYCLNPDNRFTKIDVQVNNPMGLDAPPLRATMMLKGNVMLPNNISEVLNRPMTVTDILYLACVDVCEKRHIMVSRYPVGTDKGIYFNNIRVQSTRKHIKVIFNGKEYPFFPLIDFNIEHDKVGIQFIDTLVLSNSHLDGMGADYDGDQVSGRGLYTDEANAEADKIMNIKMSALSITGSNSKGVAKEVFNALYELTKAAEGGKVIGVAEQKVILDRPVSEYTRSWLISMFADTTDNSAKDGNIRIKKAMYQTWDKMTVPENYFYEGQKKIETTVGRFVTNKFILGASDIIGKSGYLDVIWNKPSIGSIDNLVAKLYREDQISRVEFNAYTDRRDTLGYWTSGMLAHTISEKMLKPLPQIEKMKKELFKKYETELRSGNIDVMTKVSDELVAKAKEVLADDPGMDMYLSGDLDFGNNYKNNSILKGAVMNKITNEFDFIGSSFMNGIEIKDIPAHANSILASQYPASIATADAGYLGKKLLALLQMMEVDEPDTDCGTKNLIPVTITAHNKDNMVYSYIESGKGLIQLTDDNINSYVGKRVMMRSPESCLNHKICSKCAGGLFYLLGVKYAGLFATQISHADLNLGLKAKHNSLVNLYTFNPDDIISDF